MQNRFTAKDFLYVLIGLVIAGMLFLSIKKTDREVEVLTRVEGAMKEQQAALAGLRDSIDRLAASGGASLSPEMLRRLLDGAGTAGIDGLAQRDEAEEEEARINLAERPSFVPAADIRFGAWTRSLNLRGEGQQWQTAPDAELPEDFAAGDTLIWTWPSDAQTLTPLVATDAYSRYVFWYTHEALIHFDLDAPFDYLPGLAREWHVSPDGMEITFHLFPNATWSDGRPVTAEDVIFTWDTVFNPRIDAARYRSYLEPNVESWEALDTHTVRFRMKQAYFDALGVCGNLLFIIPRHVYGDFDEETFNNNISDLVVGSGPMVLDRWERNRQIVMRRNENYWGPKTALSGITVRIMQNELANLQEFRSGNVDLIAPSPEQWTENLDSEWLSERGRGMLYYSPLGGYAYIGYNMRRPHFADRRTRQALTMLLDREAIIDNLLAGQGQPISGPFYFRADQNNPNIEPWPYDPDRARELLAEAGWRPGRDGVLEKDLTGDGRPNPFEITFLVPAGGTAFARELQRFVQDAFRQAGIIVNLDALEWSVFLERLLERQFDVTSLAWTGGTESDPYQIWHSSQWADRGSNHVGFNNAEADRLIEQARATLDYDERMAMWHRLHEILHEEQPYTFLFGRPSRNFVHNRFRNVIHHDYRLYFGEWYVPVMDQIR